MTIRPAAVSGLFYPRERENVVRELGEFFDQVDPGLPRPGFPKVIIAPHAGFIYSGSIAARAYDLLRPARGIVRRVVMLCPCHRVAVRGMALPGATAFDTPLGRVAVDTEAIRQVQGFPGLVDFPEAHRQEHAIEVQLPFLQEVLGEFLLVPVIVGATAPAEVARFLDQLWGGEETLIVISTDLSHYHDYETAHHIDAGTAQTICSLNPGITHEQACGATPLGGALIAAAGRRLACRMLDLRNSGDTAGGRGRVVGYGAFELGAPGMKYDDRQGHELLSLARAVISSAMDRRPMSVMHTASWLRERRATFVTLKTGGRLRGCIGALEASRPLIDDVMSNAQSAAFRDPRFPPLDRRELEALELEVSILARPSRLMFADEEDLLGQIVPGEDGLILHADVPGGGRRATFLPQVWHDIPDPRQFLAQLKLKAGLAADTRTERCTIRRYRVVKWRSSADREAA